MRPVASIKPAVIAHLILAPLTLHAAPNPDVPRWVIIEGDVDLVLFEIDRTQGGIETDPIPGHVTTDFRFDTGAEDFSIGSLWIELEQGSIFQTDAQHGCCLASLPNALLVVNAPEVEYDTYMHNGSLDPNDPVTADLAAFHTYFGTIFTTGAGQPPRFDTGGINQTWFDETLSESGPDLRVARLTLTDDARGFWEAGFITGITGGKTFQQYLVGGGDIRNGRFVVPPIIPEPSSGVLMLVGLAVVIRCGRP